MADDEELYDDLLALVDGPKVRDDASASDSKKRSKQVVSGNIDASSPGPASKRTKAAHDPHPSNGGAKEQHHQDSTLDDEDWEASTRLRALKKLTSRGAMAFEDFQDDEGGHHPSEPTRSTVHRESGEEDEVTDGPGDVGEADEMTEDAIARATQNMTELEKEQFIAEVEEKRQRRKERALIKQKLQESRAHTHQSTKDRKKLDPKQQKANALEKLKAQRQKKADQAAKANAREKEKKKSLYSYSDDDDDDQAGEVEQDGSGGFGSETDDDDEYHEDEEDDDDAYTKKVTSQWSKRGEHASESVREGKASTRINTDVLTSDMQGAQVRREDIARWMHTPFFEDMMIGMYFRWHFEPDKKKYRVMEVRDILPWKRTYQVAGAGRKMHAIKKGFTALYGKTPYRLTFDRISNGHFEEEEIRRWRAMLQQDHIREPSRADLADAKARLEKQRNHNLTPAEVDAMIKSKRLLDHTASQVASAGYKLTLLNDLERAKAADDENLVHQLQAALDKIEEKAMIREAEMERQSAVWDSVNERNRTFNLQEGARAEIAGRRREVNDPNASGLDPFKRIKAQPKLFRDTTMLQANQTTTPSGALTIQPGVGNVTADELSASDSRPLSAISHDISQALLMSDRPISAEDQKLAFDVVLGTAVDLDDVEL